MGLAPGTKLGPYEVLAPLGAGGMGEVYEARDPRLDRRVALKVIRSDLAAHPDRLARFEREAKAVAALNHPNILAIHDIGSHEGGPYLVTELLEGQSLYDRLKGGALPIRKTIEFSIQIAQGLAAAHAEGIVHRDLKPGNVFITKDGRAKLLDFGLARHETTFRDPNDTHSPTVSVHTETGAVVGTVAYMSPEQARGKPVDHRSDQFSFGVVLYEMLAGRRPFARETAAETLVAIIREEPEPLEKLAPHLPAHARWIVERCLAKDPRERYASTEDLERDLELALRAVSSESGTSGASTPATRPWHVWLSAHRAPAGALAILLVAAFPGLLIWRHWKTNPSAPGTAATGDRSWGPPRQITSAPGWEGEPALSPDGKLVAYSSNASGNADLWVVDPRGGEPLHLAEGPGDKRNPAWFPDGQTIAFSSTSERQSSIWKISRLGGSASLLVENADKPAVSPDGSLIAFCRTGPSGNLRIWVSSLADPTRARSLTGDESGPGNHVDPAFSADGETICFSDSRNLWLVPARGGAARALTSEDKGDREPVFASQDGSVFFSSGRSDPRSVFRIPLSGGIPERVLGGTGPANHPSLSTDGHHLVFSTLAIHRDVVVIDRKTGNVCRFASSRNVETPALSSNGSAVVYVSNRIGKYDLWIEDLQSGCPDRKPPRRLTNLETGPATPVFSPDGEWVAFFRLVKNWSSIWAVPTTGGEPVPLMESPAKDLHPSYSPDGTRLAFVSNRSGRNHVWVLPLRAGLPIGEPWRLTDGETLDEVPAWSPDGNRLAFLREDDLWLVDVRRDAPSRRITSGAEAHHLAWEADGDSLLLSGLFGTAVLEVRRIRLPAGSSEPLKPRLVLGDRDGGGYMSLSRDGRFLATDITERKGNLWTSETSRDGR